MPIEIKPLVDELNLLFRRLQEEFERNKRFASDAAHELRTPLAALRTQSQVVLLSQTQKERETALKNILLSVDRCTHIIHQLLTLSRMGQKAILDNIKPLSIYSITAETIAQLAPTALEKDIEIELKEPTQPTKINGNEIAINILIRNLVDNAIRYTPEKGGVTAEIIANTHTVTLRICDTGPGIPLELRERVFERFYRILGTQTAGSGLGLAIVQQIADLHKAKIKLSTPSTGQGLQVDVIFPSAN
jgi:two-component system sensor histidine kinase QseC